MISILHEQLRRRLPQTQDDCVAIAVRQSLAMYGRLDDGLVGAACYGMVKGLFGPAFVAADLRQRLKWFRMAKRQYARIASGRPEAPPATRGPKN